MIIMYTILSSCAFFLFLQKLLFPRLSARLPVYQQLKRDQQLEWNVRLTSTIHAVYVTVLAIHVVFVETQPTDDLLLLDSFLGKSNICWSCGFMIADLLLIFVHKEKVGGSMGFAAHHAITIFGYYVCLSNELLVYHANFKMISEMSTAFVNTRWMLSVCKMKQTKIYLYNGLLMTLTFFLSRICLAPFFWQTAYTMLHTETYANRMPAVTHCIWLALSVTLDCFNVVWMNKMIRGVSSFFMVKKAASE